MPVSPWFDDLQDDPNHYLLVSDGGTLDTYALLGLTRPTWINDVIRPGGARQGDYVAFQVIDGEDVLNARDCVVAHADAGDEDSQSWNTLTTGTEPDPGVCRAIPTLGTADIHTSTTSTGIRVGNNPTIGLVAGSTFAELSGPSYALWFLPVRDNLDPWGLLNQPSPVDYGYPEDAVVEYEDTTVGLTAIYLADGDPVATTTAEHASRWVLNSTAGPNWQDGNTDAWKYGPVDEAPGGTPDPDSPWLTFDYTEGSAGVGDWHLIPGFGDWDGHGWTEGYSGSSTLPATSDAVVVAWPEDYLIPADITTTDFVSTRPARIAVKFVLQASRFRFVYDGPTSVPPRRIFGRSDGATHGARRVFGGGNSVQSGNRTLGGIL